MDTLLEFIARRNAMAELFNQPTITPPLMNSEIRTLYDELSSELSPENLTCDGELDAASVAERSAFLSRALHELEYYEEFKTGVNR